jgi:hypothetical protein
MTLLFASLFDTVYRSKIGLKSCCRIANSLNWHFPKIQSELSRKISPELKILRGPFKEMRFPNTPAITSATILKFVGADEQELYLILERCFEKVNYSTVINIGCGEGYYAVGAALRLPQAHILVFDLSLDRGEQCKSTAKVNGVENRIMVLGACTPGSLLKISDVGRCLILCDCESAELDLLHPENIPFSKYDILVETHDTPPSRTIITALWERFSTTLTEFRPFPMTWLWIEAK